MRTYWGIQSRVMWRIKKNAIVRRGEKIESGDLEERERNDIEERENSDVEETEIGCVEE